MKRQVTTFKIVILIGAVQFGCVRGIAGEQAPLEAQHNGSKSSPLYLLTYDHGGLVLWGQEHFVRHLQGAIDWLDRAFSEYCTDEGCIHRMVRDGDWKLDYYHGQEPQLFNLREDPEELRDRTQDPGCRATRERLLGIVLDGWDPEAVGRRMRQKRDDLDVLYRWAQRVVPPETYRWPLKPEMDYLDPA